jgi:uncharacterized protein (TIGR03083 family)
MSELLSKSQYVDAVRSEGAAISAACGADLDLAVPSCEGWDLADLAAHVGRVYTSVAMHIERRATEMIPRDEVPAPPTNDAMMAWFDECHQRVVAALADIEPDEPIWTWAANSTGGFYHRRMAQETLMHRWDAENSHGGVGPIDGDLAADGVSELYESVVNFATRNWEKPVPEGSLHLHRTDGEGEWLLDSSDDVVVLTYEHAKGDAAVRATGADLLLLGWERIDLDGSAAEVFGDRAVAEAWFALSP